MGVTSSCCFQSQIESNTKNSQQRVGNYKRVIDIVKPVSLEKIKERSCGSFNEFKQLMEDCQEVDPAGKASQHNIQHKQLVDNQFLGGERTKSLILMEIKQMPITGCSFIDKFKDKEKNASISSSKYSKKSGKQRKRASSKPSPLLSSKQAPLSKQSLKQLEILGLKGHK